MALSIRMLKPLARIQITKSKLVISVRKFNTTPAPSVCASALNLVTFQNNKHNLQSYKWSQAEKKHDFTIDRLVVVFIIIIIIELKKNSGPKHSLAIKCGSRSYSYARAKYLAKGEFREQNREAANITTSFYWRRP